MHKNKNLMYTQKGCLIMITYLKMKHSEWKIKKMLYGTIAAVMENKKDILDLLQKMYIALKDVPVDELQKEFVDRLAEIIHSENHSSD